METIQDTSLEIKLIQLVNSFQNTIALNNLLVKEKILRKLNMISNLRYYGIPIMNYPLETGNKIIDQLNAIDKTGDIVQYKERTNNANKLLGDILHNAYQASGYNILLSNIPQFGLTIDNQEPIFIDSEAIYDTLEKYSEKYSERYSVCNDANISSVENVIQISGDSYLAKVRNIDIAKKLCDLLNNKMMIQQIIKVEYIESSGIMNHIDGINYNELCVNNNFNNIYSNIFKTDNKIYKWFKYIISKVLSAIKLF